MQYICKENISAFFKNGKFHAKTKGDGANLVWLQSLVLLFQKLEK